MAMKKDKNYMDDICEYLRKNIKKGYTMEALKWALVRQGYAKIEVEKAIKKVELEMAKAAPILDAKPKITYEQIAATTTEVEPEKKSFWKKVFG
jgi:hypothetical protein